MQEASMREARLSEAGLPTTDLTVTMALRGLRIATDMLPDSPAPPAIERARQLVRHRNEVRPHVVPGG
jgi:hypothetical protein